MSDKAPSTLLLDKHIEYIASYGHKKDDYVSNKQKAIAVACIVTCYQAKKLVSGYRIIYNM